MVTGLAFTRVFVRDYHTHLAVVKVPDVGVVEVGNLLLGCGVSHVAITAAVVEAVCSKLFACARKRRAGLHTRRTMSRAEKLASQQNVRLF